MLLAGFCWFDLSIKNILLIIFSFCQRSPKPINHLTVTGELSLSLLAKAVDCNTKNVVLNGSCGDDIVGIDFAGFRPISGENQQVSPL